MFPRIALFIVLFLSLNVKGQTFYYQNQVREIISLEKPLLEKQQSIDSLISINRDSISDLELAECYHDVGLRLYYREWKKNSVEKNIKTAIENFEKAAKIKRNLTPLNEHELKRTLYNLGFCYGMNNELFKSIKAYSELVKLEEIDITTLNAYRELGKALKNVGDYYRAIEAFDKLIGLTKDQPGFEKQLLQGYYRRAETYSDIDINKFNSKIKADLEIANSINNLQTWKGERFFNEVWQLEGNRLLKSGDYEKAIDYFQTVIKQLDRYDSLNLGIVYSSLGVAYKELGLNEETKKALDRSIKLSPGESPAYENLAEYYYIVGNFEKSIEYYQKAVSLAFGSTFNEKKEYNEKSLKNANYKHFMLHHLIGFGEIKLKLYHKTKNHQILDDALELFKTADKLVDIIRFESYEPKSKLYWREQSAALYLSAVETAYLLDRPELAYYFMEKNKAILLLEDISENEAIENASIPYELVYRELKMKRTIISLQKQQEAEKLDQDSISQKLFSVKTSHSQFLDSIGAAFPVYASLKKQIEIKPFDEFRKQLITSDKNVIQYILDESKGFGLVNTISDTIFFEVNNIAELQEEIKQLLDKSSNILTTQDAFDQYKKLANSISVKIFPDGYILSEKGKQIKVIPDNTLQLISFESLMLGDRYLINDVEFNYAYSITHLLENSQRNRSTRKDFISFAPITFNYGDLPALPNSENEAMTLKKITNGEVMLKTDASKNQFIAKSQDYKVLHLSTHADIGNEIDPWIAFADDKVSLRELHTIDNQAEMVVLSACNTSLGTLKSGEGILSLARGFSNAGANSVVSSLWPTNDLSNMELMKDFYQGLEDGLTKSSALREAKLKYLTSHSGTERSPYYWASLTLTGNNDELSFSESSGTMIFVYFIIFLTLIAALSLVLWRRIKLNQSNAA